MSRTVLYVMSIYLLYHLRRISARDQLSSCITFAASPRSLGPTECATSKPTRATFFLDRMKKELTRPSSYEMDDMVLSFALGSLSFRCRAVKARHYQ